MLDRLEINGVKVEHHFGGGVYAKETFIPFGVVLTQHIHPHAHLSILAKGRVIVEAGTLKQEFEAPACLTIAEGVEHRVQALEDAIWYCIHATADTEPSTVDTSILTGR